ncbi:hypothetical protein Tco_1272924, partial [Tanacetum coccineum]
MKMNESRCRFRQMQSTELHKYGDEREQIQADIQIQKSRSEQ